MKRTHAAHPPNKDHVSDAVEMWCLTLTAAVTSLHPPVFSVREVVLVVGQLVRSIFRSPLRLVARATILRDSAAQA
eukprot:615972-Pleurochrysis_carterae.AAC.2